MKGSAMKKTEAIKQLIEKINTEKPDTVRLNPVILLGQVKAFEKKYGITLPKDYVEFITQIGDGAVIKSDVYGTQELLALGSYEARKYPAEKPNVPFPLQRSWMPDWGDVIEGAEDEEDEDVIEQLVAERWAQIETQGNLPLMLDNTCNSMGWILIINGVRKGEMWEISEYGIFRLAKCGFMRWLELFLTDGLNDFMAECKKIEYPQEEDLLERCRKFVKKERIVMNPPTGLEEIHTFEKRHNISLPEEYIAFLTQIGNGAKKSPWYLSEIYTLSDNDSQENLDKPFMIQTEEDYNRIFFDEKGYDRLYESRGGKTIWECVFDKRSYEGKEAKFPWAMPQFQLLGGCLPIIGRGTAADPKTIVWQYVLVLNGEYRGEVWRITQETISRLTIPELHVNALTIMEQIAYGGE